MSIYSENSPMSSNIIHALKGVKLTNKQLDSNYELNIEIEEALRTDNIEGYGPKFKIYFKSYLMKRAQMDFIIENVDSNHWSYKQLVCDKIKEITCKEGIYFEEVSKLLSNLTLEDIKKINKQHEIKDSGEEFERDSKVLVENPIIDLF